MATTPGAGRTFALFLHVVADILGLLLIILIFAFIVANWFLP